MCSVKAPKPTVIEADKPTFVRNPFLDELDGDVASADALRRGRSSLVIPTAPGTVGFEGRSGSGGRSATGTPKGNARTPRGSLAIPGTTGDTGPYGGGRAPYRPPSGGGGSTFKDD